jgi:hypothetical protein
LHTGKNEQDRVPKAQGSLQARINPNFGEKSHDNIMGWDQTEIDLLIHGDFATLTKSRDDQEMQRRVDYIT